VKRFIHLLQLLVGVLFIFSGVVKAIDPTGTAIKMGEYFQVFNEYAPALGGLWDLCNDMALPISMFMVIFEIIVGLALLYGLFFNVATWSLLAMLIFFTFLTGFTMTTGKVTDCGCFGDFLKLEPYQTFWKDVVLSIMAITFWVFRKKATPFKTNEMGGFVLMGTLAFVIIAFLSWYGIKGKLIIIGIGLAASVGYAFFHQHGRGKSLGLLKFGILSVLTVLFTFRNVNNLPIANFRPYKIGVDLKTCTSEEGLDPGKTLKTFTLKSKASGEEITASSDDYMAKKMWTEYDVVKGKTVEKVLVEPEEPPCKDFKIYDADGESVEEEIKNFPGWQFLVCSYDIDKSDKGGFVNINALIEEVKSNKIAVNGLTGADIADANEQSGGLYAFNNLDATPIKTMIRANPGLILLKNGVIHGRYHYNHLPDAQELLKELNK